jgi:hypothetical protein
MDFWTALIIVAMSVATVLKLALVAEYLFFSTGEPSPYEREETEEERAAYIQAIGF